MALFKSFAPDVEVSASSVLAFLNAIQPGRRFRRTLLKEYGIELEGKEWVSFQDYLDALEEIDRDAGPHTMFLMGRAIPENADMPADIQNVEAALRAISPAYKMNHRGGEVGDNTVEAFDGENKRAVMRFHNPYPIEFDRGVITGMVNRYSDTRLSDITVEHLPGKPTRNDGADACWFEIKW